MVAMCLLVSGFLNGSVFGAAMQAHGADLIIDRVQAVINTRLDGGRSIKPLACQGEMICGIQLLPKAYANKNHRPLWIDAMLRLERAEALAEAIGRAGEDGLDPRDYHLEAIIELLADFCEQSSAAGPASISPERWADLDLILTDAFLLYGSHLAAGRVNPETLHTDWKINPIAVDLLPSLEHAASTGDIDAALQKLRPAHNGYSTLRNALARLRGLAAAQGLADAGCQPNTQAGDRGAAVGNLGQRLAATGDIEENGPGTDSFIFDTANRIRGTAISGAQRVESGWYRGTVTPMGC
jgi:murein L,D-transpeptidase YcbB/YkuD